MHEMSLCEGIVQILEEQAVTQGYHRVKTVWQEVGNLSGAEPESLRFGFDVITKGTLAEDARLVIIEMPARAWCHTCEAQVSLRHRLDGCPDCGGYQLQVTGGDELRIKELEVE